LVSAVKAFSVGSEKGSAEHTHSAVTAEHSGAFSSSGATDQSEKLMLKVRTETRWIKLGKKEMWFAL